MTLDFPFLSYFMVKATHLWTSLDPDSTTKVMLRFGFELRMYRAYTQFNLGQVRLTSLNSEHILTVTIIIPNEATLEIPIKLISNGNAMSLGI